jgi:predicted transposase/invertase (TIGR01784 family)
MSSKQKLVRFDWAVKKLLRNKANFDILEGFLSELFGFDVKIKTLLESESNQEYELDKFNRVDILTEIKGGELVLVEIQNESEQDYFQRMLYGSSKLVTEYLKSGEPYGKIKKIFSVNIVYFDLGKGDDYVYTGTTSFVGMHTQKTLQPSLMQQNKYNIEKVSDIFPVYYLLKINNFDKVAEDSLDEWIYFLKTSEIYGKHPAKGLATAAEKMRYEQLTDEERAAYSRFEENRRIEASVTETAYEKGINTVRELLTLEVKEKEEAKARAEEERRQKEEAEAKAEEERRQKEILLTASVQAFRSAGFADDKIAEMLKVSVETVKKIE